MLLLRRFSRVRLCVTPQTAAHQAPPSLGFSSQEHEWVAISFSNAWKWKVKVKLLSHVRLCATPWNAAYQAPPSMGFFRQEYWSGVPLPSPKSVFRYQIIKHLKRCILSYTLLLSSNVSLILCSYCYLKWQLSPLIIVMTVLVSPHIKTYIPVHSCLFL